MTFFYFDRLIFSIDENDPIRELIFKHALAGRDA